MHGPELDDSVNDLKIELYQVRDLGLEFGPKMQLDRSRIWPHQMHILA